MCNYLERLKFDLNSAGAILRQLGGSQNSNRILDRELTKDLLPRADLNIYIVEF